jgi:hypothetical protein
MQANDTDEDCEFLKQVENFESSLVETPVSSRRNIFVDSSKKEHTKETSPLNEVKKCLNYAQNSDDDECLMNELMKCESNKTFDKSVLDDDDSNPVNNQEESEEEEDPEADRKYTDVLKRYFGYSKFRK